MKKLFESATLRLTGWYVLILMILSLLFSVIVFRIATNEFHRQYRPGNYGRSYSLPISTILDEFERLQAQREAESTRRLVANLVVFNMTILAAGGIASYFLARRTLQPIEQALDAQVRFSSDVAHELRTPLAVMQSEIEVGLRSSKPTVRSQQELLASNLDEVHRLRALTDRLLLLASDKTLPLMPTRLDELATEAINRVIPLAQAKRIGIDSTIGPLMAQANAEALTDAVVILLDNAIKYSPDGSAVVLSASTHGRMVLMHIADNGPGIATQDLPRIFDRFYRADTSRSKTNVEGHGLGLSIARRIVESHRGKLTVESTPGAGSIFTIHLQQASPKKEPRTSNPQV